MTLPVAVFQFSSIRSLHTGNALVVDLGDDKARIHIGALYLAAPVNADHLSLRIDSAGADFPPG